VKDFVFRELVAKQNLPTGTSLLACLARPCHFGRLPSPPLSYKWSGKYLNHPHYDLVEDAVKEELAQELRQYQKYSKLETPATPPAVDEVPRKRCDYWLKNMPVIRTVFNLPIDQQQTRDAFATIGEWLDETGALYSRFSRRVMETHLNTSELGDLQLHSAGTSIVNHVLRGYLEEEEEEEGGEETISISVAQPKPKPKKKHY
jgi:hypothetical protein